MISQYQIAIGMPLINADNTNLPVRQRYEVDTSGAARAVTLPPATVLQQGDWVEFIEPIARNQLATNNLTINAGAGTTIRGTTPYTVNVNNVGVLLMYRGTNWESFVTTSSGAIAQATETASGGGEIATRAETLAGILDTHLITPTKVRDFVGRQANYSNINNGVTIDNHIGLAVLDASGAAFALNLPTISAAIPAPWRIRVIKTDASANDVTINRSGTDTFNDGSTSKTISGQHTFAEFIRRDAGNVWHYQAYSAGAGTLATQAQAVAGTDNSAYMSPLRTREVLGGVTGYTFANNNNTIVSTTGFGFVDTTAGATTLNLPLSSSVPANHRIRITKTDASANALTISRSGTDTFNDAATTKVLNGQHAYAEFINRGSGIWHYQAPSAGGTLATQAQALAGTDNVAFMSALRTREVLGNVVQYSNANNGNTIAVTVGFARIDGSVAFTLNLPDGANIPDNHRIRFVKMDATANALTVSRSGTNTFNDGATTKTLVGQHNYAEAIYRGAGVWHWQAAPAALTVATQAQALAGTDNATVMTPLRVRETLGRVTTYTDANHNNTIALDVGVVIMNNTTGGATLNLPDVANVAVGHRLRVVKVSPNQIFTLALNGTGATFHDTAENAVGLRFYQDNSYVELVYIGSNTWQVTDDHRSFHGRLGRAAAYAVNTGVFTGLFANQIQEGFASGMTGATDGSGTVQLFIPGYYTFQAKARFAQATANGFFALAAGTEVLQSLYVPANTNQAAMQISITRHFTLNQTITFSALQTTGANLNLNEIEIRLFRHPYQSATI